jgi:cytochrome c oxidase subunit 3
VTDSLEKTEARPSIDVSRLPAESRDTRSPAWWGNMLFMLIETSTVALLLASYVYLWKNHPQSDWPPPAAQYDPPILKPVPAPVPGVFTVLVLLVSVPVMLRVDVLCRRQFDALERAKTSKPAEAGLPQRPAGVFIGMGLMLALITVSLVLRWYEFAALFVQWNENAYAAIVWTALGLHFIYIAVELLEVVVLTVWIALYGLGENQATDVILTAEYWYWTVGIGLLIHGVVYWFPRLT